MAEVQKLLYRMNDAADKLGITRRVLDKLISRSDGVIRPIQIGKRKLLHADNVQKISNMLSEAASLLAGDIGIAENDGGELEMIRVPPDEFIGNVQELDNQAIGAKRGIKRSIRMRLAEEGLYRAKAAEIESGLIQYDINRAASFFIERADWCQKEAKYLEYLAGGGPTVMGDRHD